MCVCVCMCVFARLCVFVSARSMCMCLRVFVFARLSVFVSARLCVCVCACVCVLHVRVCVCACACVCQDQVRRSYYLKASESRAEERQQWQCAVEAHSPPKLFQASADIVIRGPRGCLGPQGAGVKPEAGTAHLHHN